VIAVTCRNGEHFSVDPASIERIENRPDTVVYLVDGTKYVVSEGFDDLLRDIQDHRAMLLAVQQQMYGGIAEVAAHRTHLRVERRSRSRDGDSGHCPPDGALADAVLPDVDED
jgi:flagellar protein FlbD